MTTGIKKSLLLILTLSLLACATKKTTEVTPAPAVQEYAQHRQPEKPFYISENSYPRIRKSVANFPVAGSEAQKKDEAILLEYQNKRTEAQCVQARGQVHVKLNDYFDGQLSEKEVNLINPFFEKVRNDGSFYVLKVKNEFARQRPFLYVPSLNPCVPKEVSSAYPSGHASNSRLNAHVLSDLFPKKKIQLLSKANEIAENRVLGGVHHTTDIEAGKKLGDILYSELKKSKAYQAEIKQIKAQLK